MFTKQKRRKLDQFLRGNRKEPETALAEMTQLSNRLWKLFLGTMLTTIFLVLLLEYASWQQAVGLGVLLFLVNGLGWVALLRAQPGLFDRPAVFNQYLILILLTVGFSRFIFWMGWSPFLAPLPMLGMVLAMILGQPAAYMTVIGVGFYLALLSPRLWGMDAGAIPAAFEGLSDSHLKLLRFAALLRIDNVLCLALILGGVVSVLGVQRLRQQSRPALVGVLVGIVQALVVIAFRVLEPDFPPPRLLDPERLRWLLTAPGWAFAGGVISGGLVTIFLPAIERLFSIITERRLLALSDPNNELLWTLRNRAPGTYQHTLGVAQLASAASEAIGADALLAQVGAYYHDIGKIVKPEYFVENMGVDKSIHSRLRPSMSKLIIISHVKEGIDLAREEGLPQKIIDMIPMHHGTTVVEYFFHKALEQKGVESRENEVDYRYPGPKPRFAEAAVLMIADSVEAIAKTISDPNPTRFRSMVHEVILKRLLDGQFDEANLTTRDLKGIEDSFVRTLTNVYHGRIRYPGGEERAAVEAPPPEPDSRKEEPGAASHRRPGHVLEPTRSEKR